MLFVFSDIVFFMLYLVRCLVMHLSLCTTYELCMAVQYIDGLLCAIYIYS